MRYHAVSNVLTRPASDAYSPCSSRMRRAPSSRKTTAGRLGVAPSSVGPGGSPSARVRPIPRSTGPTGATVPRPRHRWLSSSANVSGGVTLVSTTA